MNPKFDLLGDPIPDNYGKAGANGHIATAENINKVRLLLIAGMDKKDIAAELGISQPTLTKHYFQSGCKAVKDARRRALADERAKNLLRLDKAAEKGNVTAIKELNAVLSAEAMKDRARDAAGDGDQPAPRKASTGPTGKKDQQIAQAQQALLDDDMLNPKVH